MTKISKHNSEQKWKSDDSKKRYNSIKSIAKAHIAYIDYMSFFLSLNKFQIKHKITKRI